MRMIWGCGRWKESGGKGGRDHHYSDVDLVSRCRSCAWVQFKRHKLCSRYFNAAPMSMVMCQSCYSIVCRVFWGILVKLRNIRIMQYYIVLQLHHTVLLFHFNNTISCSVLYPLYYNQIICFNFESAIRLWLLIIFNFTLRFTLKIGKVKICNIDFVCFLYWL